MFGKSTSVYLLLAAASTLVSAQNSTSNTTTGAPTDFAPIKNIWDIYAGPETETVVPPSSNVPGNSTSPFGNSSRTSNAALSTGTGAFSNARVANLTGPLGNGTFPKKAAGGGPFRNPFSGNNPAANSTMPNNSSSNGNDTSLFNSIFPGLNSTRTLNSSTIDPATNTTKDPSKPTVKAVDPRFPPVTPCQNGAGPFHGCGKCVNSSAIAPVPLAKANLTDFDNTMFVSQDGSGGGKTWFSVPAVGDSCKVLIFGETPGGLAPPHGLPGVAITVASNEGCYFANTGSKIAISFCCGNDECNAVSQGLYAASAPKGTRRSIEAGSQEITSIPNRRSVPYQPPSLMGAVEKRDDPVYTFFTPSNTYSATSNWVAPEVPQQWCEPATEADKNTEFSAAGAQQFTGNMQTCSGTFCSFSVDVTVTTGSSMETESSTQDTASHGMNWSGTFGWSWGVTATATVGGDKSWSNALTNSTSYTNTTSTSTGLTGSLGVQPGTWAQLGLVPQMNCRLLQSKCHNGTNSAIINSTVCKPALSADGKTPMYLTWPVTLG